MTVPITPQTILFAMLNDTQDDSSADLQTQNTSQENAAKSQGAEWTPGESKLLLEYYSKYYPEIGPMKRFKTKKAMFEQIAIDLQSILGISRTALQCDNRYKTLLKRKKNSQKVNKTSGSSRCTVEFEEEFARIRSMDDSLEPEVRRGVSTVIYKTTTAAAETRNATSSEAVAEDLSSNPTSPPNEHRAETSAEARRRRRRANRVSSGTTRQQQMTEFFVRMKELHDEKEKNRERRHREHLEVHKQHMQLLTEMRDAYQQNGSLL